MTEEQKARLLTETYETTLRLNKLNTFMADPAFPKLPREDKDLLYSQQRVMSEYVQILGKRLERSWAIRRPVRQEPVNGSLHEQDAAWAERETYRLDERDSAIREDEAAEALL
jgi:hypothetical protein